MPFTCIFIVGSLHIDVRQRQSTPHLLVISNPYFELAQSTWVFSPSFFIVFWDKNWWLHNGMAKHLFSLRHEASDNWEHWRLQHGRILVDLKIMKEILASTSANNWEAIRDTRGGDKSHGMLVLVLALLLAYLTLNRSGKGNQNVVCSAKYKMVCEQERSKKS